MSKGSFAGPLEQVDSWCWRIPKSYPAAWRSGHSRFSESTICWKDWWRTRIPNRGRVSRVEYPGRFSLARLIVGENGVLRVDTLAAPLSTIHAVISARVLIFYTDFERLAGKRNTLPARNADRDFGDACLHLLGNPHGAVELVISASLSKFCESLHRLVFG